MPRFLIALLALLAWTQVSLAETAPRPLAIAMQAMRSGDWQSATRISAKDGAVAADIIEWHRLRAGRGSYADTIAFLARRPDWPGLQWLRRKSEPELAKMTGEQRRTFFAAFPPQTPEGALAHAEALAAAGDTDAANEVVVKAFKTMKLTSETQAALFDGYASVLAPHLTARLDHALWSGWSADARRLLPFVAEDWRKLAEARLALRAQSDGVDALIAAVPSALADHPGLAYERFVWRARRGLATATDLLLERSGSADRLGRPEAWAPRRRNLARDVMRDRNHRLAYRIASSHQLETGRHYADLEWLSGYLALRFLNDPERAIRHFDQFKASVFTPISLGRAGYWRGRALEAAGRPDAARAAYLEGAAFPTSFYGLLAAERAGQSVAKTLRGERIAGDWREAPYTQSSVHQAAVLLLASGEMSLAERFWVHLAETQSPRDWAVMGQMALDLGQPHVAVMIGKFAARQGLEIPEPYYALHPIAKRRLPVKTELALAIARRESEFDPRVVSGAGARGLMQLMPGTANLMAGKLDLPHDLARLLSDPDYNATLGSAYLAQLGAEFDGNILMVSAGYNAGPGRPVRWMQRFGDLRRGEVDAIDWIEHIPFSETRNYVMRVAESLPVYRVRLGQDPLPQPFSRELVGSSVLPLSP